MGLDPMRTKLAVVGDVNRRSPIVLAATPPLKDLGIKKMRSAVRNPATTRHTYCQSNHGNIYRPRKVIFFFTSFLVYDNIRCMEILYT